ncbi:Type 1 glutamine amidotransferase-like domain-containing protein [Nocardioides convexus]|uniref:Type 1 glutamine amidotransferase-like domain-containing protein n=1 Tax=Nocardioides convexus TaxID=2712224 RepID=UPI0024189CF8|nr:Type 1 glutamine amidotransferase-like domain-containing protein [Nocardioides convexus]
MGEVMREAWQAGVVLTGVSAGSICWHTSGTTDSFGPDLRPVTNGLGLVPWSNGVHYDSEEQRRPLFQEPDRGRDAAAGLRHRRRRGRSLPRSGVRRCLLRGARQGGVLRRACGGRRGRGDPAGHRARCAERPGSKGTQAGDSASGGTSGLSLVASVSVSSPVVVSSGRSSVAGLSAGFGSRGSVV